MSELVINHTPGVCGGRACIGARRLTVWLVVQNYQMNGGNASVTADCFDITPAHVEAALTYYAEHTAEIDADIAENEQALRDAEVTG